MRMYLVPALLCALFNLIFLTSFKIGIINYTDGKKIMAQ